MIPVRTIEEQKTPEQGGGSYFRIHPEDVKLIPEKHFGSNVIDGVLNYFESQQEADEKLPKPPPLDPNFKEEKPVVLTDDDLAKLKSILAPVEPASLVQIK